MVPTPSWSATRRMDRAARPSPSATWMAASTMASTLSPGLGPRLGRSRVSQSSSMLRAGSLPPLYSLFMNVPSSGGLRPS
jgi:hypothetical protein